MHEIKKNSIESTPFFSIIVPTYNCADLLRRSLLSVSMQTFQDFEIIVIDNSSSDHTSQVIKSIKNSALSKYTIQNEGIIARSRNLAIQKAQGRWLAFLDADDVWLPRKLEVVHDIILKNSDIIGVCHDEWKIVNGAKEKRLHYKPSKPDLYEFLLFHGNCLSPSATVVRKDVAKNIGGFSTKEDFITVEDYEFWIRLSREGKIYFSDEVLGEYHIHSKNASGKLDAHAHALIAVGEYHLNLWFQENPFSQMKYRKGKGKIMTIASRILLKGKSFEQAQKTVAQALKSNPLSWKAWAILLLIKLRIAV